jgi:hypothetical protein
MLTNHPLLLLLLLLLCQQLQFGTAHKILVRSQNATNTKTQHWLKVCRYIQPLVAVHPLNYVRKKIAVRSKICNAANCLALVKNHDQPDWQQKSTLSRSMCLMRHLIHMGSQLFICDTTEAILCMASRSCFSQQRPPQSHAAATTWCKKTTSAITKLIRGLS